MPKDILLEDDHGGGFCSEIHQGTTRTFLRIGKEVAGQEDRCDDIICHLQLAAGKAAAQTLCDS